MGFYIQDDYYTAAVGSFKSRTEQDAFWGLLIRYYFTGQDKSSDVRSTAVRAAFALTKSRIDRARGNANRMREKREHDANGARTVQAQNASYPSMNLESERESKKEKEKKKEKPAPCASSPCPKCGEERGAIVPGMDRCDSCDVTWKAASA